jgi:hypothetical protein
MTAVRRGSPRMISRAEELEAVARALCLVDGVDPDSVIDTSGRVLEPAWRSYHEKARRVLAMSGVGEGDPFND